MSPSRGENKKKIETTTQTIIWVCLAPTNEPRKKKNSYFPLYWLVNRDPYNGLFINPHITG